MKMRVVGALTVVALLLVVSSTLVSASSAVAGKKSYSCTINPSLCTTPHAVATAAATAAPPPAQLPKTGGAQPSTGFPTLMFALGVGIALLGVAVAVRRRARGILTVGSEGP